MSGIKVVTAWFENHRPSFTKDIVHILDGTGVATVKDLKLYTVQDAIELFAREKTLIKRKANIVWRHPDGKE